MEKANALSGQDLSVEKANVPRRQISPLLAPTFSLTLSPSLLPFLPLSDLSLLQPLGLLRPTWPLRENCCSIFTYRMPYMSITPWLAAAQVTLLLPCAPLRSFVHKKKLLCSPLLVCTQEDDGYFVSLCAPSSPFFGLRIWSWTVVPLLNSMAPIRTLASLNSL